MKRPKAHQNLVCRKECLKLGGKWAEYHYGWDDAVSTMKDAQREKDKKLAEELRKEVYWTLAGMVCDADAYADYTLKPTQKEMAGLAKELSNLEHLVVKIIKELEGK
jgi:hypothetical protein